MEHFNKIRSHTWALISFLQNSHKNKIQLHFFQECTYKPLFRLYIILMHTGRRLDSRKWLIEPVMDLSVDIIFWPTFKLKFKKFCLFFFDKLQMFIYFFSMRTQKWTDSRTTMIVILNCDILGKIIHLITFFRISI